MFSTAMPCHHSAIPTMLLSWPSYVMLYVHTFLESAKAVPRLTGVFFSLPTFLKRRSFADPTLGAALHRTDS